MSAYDSDRDVIAQLQAIIREWEAMHARQMAETDKWHRKYIELLQEKQKEAR
jgi:hypothetical protein